MRIYKFNDSEIIHNRIKAHPEYTFYIYNQNVYLNSVPNFSGAFVANVGLVPEGYISLYEINVDRPSGSLVYPFVTKDGSQGAFRTISTSAYASDFAYGDTISGTYPLSASISRNYYPATADGGVWNRRYLDALRNSLNYYTFLSPAYQYTTPDSGWNKALQEVNLISIPSIFYGSAIKRGSVDLKYYVTGTLVGELNDEAQNGELIQVGPTGSSGSGSIAGVVLYDEGFFVLTGSWDITAENTAFGPTHVEDYQTDNNYPAWVNFGSSMSGTVTAANSSYYAKIEGLNRIPAITMFAHAPKNELNHSNNKTYIKKSQVTGSVKLFPQAFYEDNQIAIKNIASSSYKGAEETFKKITYISKIGLYDDEMNLIGIAKLATPIKKSADRDFTFKLKLDI